MIWGWWGGYYYNIGTGPLNIPEGENGGERNIAINKIFRDFRLGGIEYFIDEIKKQLAEEATKPQEDRRYDAGGDAKPKTEVFVPQVASLFALCWSYSELQFAGRAPKELLEMPFFKKFRPIDRPENEDVVTIMEYTSTLRLRLAPAQGLKPPPGSPQITSCIVCNAFSEYTCHRCETRYCSAECQRRDWHRIHSKLCRDITL